MHDQGGHNKGSGRGGAAIFDPLRAMGRYEILIQSRVPLLEGEIPHSSEPSWLEIHELTPNEDGLLGTFSIGGRISGLCVLAGSRKGLDEIIRSLGSWESTPKEGDNSAQAGATDNGRKSEELSTSEQAHQISDLELEDMQLNRRAQAFEKNTFRNPKFWLKWNAATGAHEEIVPSDSSADRGYVVFSNNNCAKFEGSISSRAIGWKDVKFHGRKVRPQATPCPSQWSRRVSHPRER